MTTKKKQQKTTSHSASASIYTGEFVPARLCKVDYYPRVAATVKELRDLLADYPDNMPLGIECGDIVQVAWANIGQETECLLVYEADDDSDGE